MVNDNTVQIQQEINRKSYKNLHPKQNAKTEYTGNRQVQQARII